MIEVSAATPPALAQPGAVVPAAPAVASGESARNRDFSTLLAGAELATEAPAAHAAPQTLRETTAVRLTKLAAAASAADGKTGIAGNETGKTLPGGKRPVTRQPSAEEKPAAKDFRHTETSEHEATPVASTSNTLDVLPPLVQPGVASGSLQSLVKGAVFAPTTSSAMVSLEQRTSTIPATPGPVSAVTLAQITPPLPIAGLVAADPASVDEVKGEAPSQRTAAAIATATMLPPETAVLSKSNEPTASTAKAAQPTPVAASTDIQPAPPPTQEPRADVSEHKTAHPVQSAAAEPLALATRAEMVAAPAPAEARSASPSSSAAPNAAVTPTQDIAALVDRITEARAAAAPHVVRAAMMHEDFGAVSLNFRTDDAHIHVILGSADPGFAPAVHAAAAASLAGGNRDDNAHRGSPTPEPSEQSQDVATQNNVSFQQQASRERTASGGERGTPREPAFRQPSGSAEHGDTSSAPQRRSGIYA